MPALEDGRYDVIVVEATEDPDDVMRLDVAISSGPHRGEVISITAVHLGRSWIDALAAPATLTVEEGRPVLSFD
jgi:cell division protein FtsX